jgi:mannitol-specific phosphotransferase system IIBC component
MIDFHQNNISITIIDRLTFHVPSLHCILRFEKNQKDIADFDRAVKNMRTKDDAKSTSLVEKFEKAKRLIVRELTGSSVSSSSSGSSRAEGQRMVRQLQEELEKVISDD